MFLSGCTNNLDLTPKDMQTNIKSLKPDEMKLIYRTIQKEINFQNKKADRAVINGYNHDAIVAYELVNYYKGYAYIPIKKISKLKKLAKNNSSHHYKYALKYIKKNKKRTLLELNNLLKNNPNHKNGLKHLKNIKDNRNINIFLRSLNSSMLMAIRNNKSSLKDVKKINHYKNELISYDYKNKFIYRAQNILESEYNNLFNKAMKQYKNEKLINAKEMFIEILSIYKNDNKTKRYLFKTNSRLSLQSAQIALNNGKCIKAINLSNKLLKKNFNNKKAKILLTKAESECKKQISKILSDGKKHYNNKNLDIAKQNFQKVLKLDPKNSISLVYTKKIDSQLKTIKSLN